MASVDRATMVIIAGVIMSAGLGVFVSGVQLGLININNPTPVTINLSITVSYYPIPAFHGNTVTFSAVPSGGVMPYACNWSFGDYSTQAGGMTVNHIYYTIGYYNVVTTCYDTQNNSKSITTSVQVV